MVAKKIEKHIIENVKSGVWVSDKDDLIYFFNKGMEKISGILRNEALGVNVLKNFSEETLVNFRPVFLEAKKTLHSKYYDALKVKIPGGRSTYQSGWLVPMVENAKYAGMICVVEDVTEKVDADKTIRALAKFPDENTNPVFRALPTGELLYFNKATHILLELWDYFKRDQLPDDVVKKIKEAVLTNTKPTLKVLCEEKIISLMFTPIVNESYVNVYGLDITELKAKERDLLESREKYKNLFENSNDAIFIHKTGEIIDVNLMATELLDYSRAQLLKMKISDFSLHPEKIKNLLNEFFKTGQLRAETEFVRSDGQIVNVDISSRFIDKENNIIQEIVRDVTAKKLVEKENLEIHKLLFHSSKLAAIGELAAGVAHEINNTLAVIDGSVARLKETVSGKNEKYVNTIGKSVKKIQDIVNRLRSLARVDNRENCEFDISDIVKETISMVSTSYKKQNIEIELNAKQHNINVFGLKGNVQQIIMNLLSNARDALVEKNGGIIKIDINSFDSYVEIKVTDNGPGINDDIKDKIFDNFFTSKPIGLSAGLGLSIVQSITRKMHGSISVDSEVGIGTIFTLSLPLAEYEMRKINCAQKFEFKPILGNVLVVDDEKDILEILVKICSSFGLRVDVANNGREALGLLAKSEYNYMITDLKMPEMDGCSLIERAYKEKLLKDTKVIVITGGLLSEYSEYERNIIKKDAGAFILKPFSKKMIYKALVENNKINLN